MSDLVGPLWSRVWFFGASGGSCPDLGGEPSKGLRFARPVRVLARPALVVRTAVESGSVVRVRTSLSAGAAKLPSPACFDDAVMRVRLSSKGSSPWFCCASYLIRVRRRRSTASSVAQPSCGCGAVAMFRLFAAVLLTVLWVFRHLICPDIPTLLSDSDGCGVGEWSDYLRRCPVVTWPCAH